MAAIFCCPSVRPYRPRLLDHEDKFQAFFRWIPSAKLSVDKSCVSVDNAPYAVQVVQQVNYGPQESIRYFVPTIDGVHFVEMDEDSLIKSNFEKLNSYKNFRCDAHNKFFEFNLYQKNPLNTHHWRYTLARPSRDIDLAFRRPKTEVETSKKMKEQGADQTSDSAFPELQQSFLPALEEVEFQQPNAISIATVKNALRILLPTVGQDLGSRRLISLLCLDWVSRTLGLDLEFEDMWTAEIDSSNIIIFIVDCVTADDASENLSLDLANVEDLVVPAIRYVDSRNGKQEAGKVRLQKIIERVLESGRDLDWVSACGDSISSVFTSGPSQKLLEHCQRKHKRLEEDRRPRNSEEIREKTFENKDYETIVPWSIQDAGYNDYHYYSGGDDYDIDNDSDFWRRAGD